MRMGRPLQYKIMIDTSEGTCTLTLYREWKEVGGDGTKFILDEESVAEVSFDVEYHKNRPTIASKLFVHSLNVDEPFRKKGLGRLLMTCMKALGTYYRCKVQLTSKIGVEGFYRKLGMKERNGTMEWIPKKRKPKRKRK